MATKIFLIVAALVVVVALMGGQDALDQGADASVEIVLDRDANVDNARQQLITDASGTWQATRTAESTESDDSASVQFSLPGSALDGLVAELRRHPLADEVEVTLDVDPSQLTAQPLGSDETGAPEPVTLEVKLTRASGGGPWVTILGAVAVAALALIALVVVNRRFGGQDGFDDGIGGDDTSPHRNLG